MLASILDTALGQSFILILLVQPSSMAAERVFSLLQNSFSHVQQSSLEDYISVSVMLQYNRKQDILSVYKNFEHNLRIIG